MFALTEKPTYERIAHIFDNAEIKYQVLPEEAGILVLFENGYIQIILQDEKILHMNGVWATTFPIEQAPQFKMFAMQINAQWLLPRCFVSTDDAGMSMLVADVVIPYPVGCSQEQLEEGVAAGVGTITNAFNEASKFAAENNFGTTPTTGQSED